MFGKRDVCLERLQGETDEWEGGEKGMSVVSDSG